MKQILIQLLLLAPVVAESVVIDPLYWRADKSDKPVSTYIRAGIIVAIALFVQFVLKDNYALAAALVMVAWYFAVFPYLINWIRNEPFFYLGDGWYDRTMKKLPGYFRLFLQLWILASAIMVYLYLNGTIYQDFTILFDIPVFR